MRSSQAGRLSKLAQRHGAQGLRAAWLTQPFQQLDFLVPFFPLTPLWLSTQSGSLAVSISIDDELKFDASLDTDSPADVVDTLKAVVTLGRNSLKDIPNPSQFNAQEFQPLRALLTELLANVTIDASEKQVTVRAQAKEATTLALRIAEPAVRSARIASEREKAQENMKLIGLALHSYHDEHGHFPPSVIEENGVKRSWRVEILPYLEQQALYTAYRKDEPWDSPANLMIANMIVPIFQPIGKDPTNKTAYRAVAGKHGTLSGGVGGKGVRKEEITDGIGSTIAFVEVPYYVPWSSPDEFDTKPEDLVAAPERKQGFLVGMADGSVFFISINVDPGVLSALLTRDGGEKNPL